MQLVSPSSEHFVIQNISSLPFWQMEVAVFEYVVKSHLNSREKCMPGSFVLLATFSPRKMNGPCEMDIIGLQFTKIIQGDIFGAVQHG